MRVHEEERAQGSACLLESLRLLPQAEEHLLHHLFGHRAVPQHPGAQREDRAGMTPVRFGERVAFVPGDRDDQPDVVGAGEPDLRTHTPYSSPTGSRMGFADSHPSVHSPAANTRYRLAGYQPRTTSQGGQRAVARIPKVLLATLVPLVAAVAVVVTLTVTSEPGSGVAAATRPNAITIKNFAFSPTPIEVKAGATITITNADGAVHTVTADRGGFDTGNIDGGGHATITIDAPGKYAYHCDIHNYMTGVIEAT